MTSVNLYQFIFRFKRLDSKSDPIIHIVNSNYKVIESIYAKSGNQKNIFNTKIKLLNEINTWNENYENMNNIIKYLNN